MDTAQPSTTSIPFLQSLGKVQDYCSANQLRVTLQESISITLSLMQQRGDRNYVKAAESVYSEHGVDYVFVELHEDGSYTLLDDISEFNPEHLIVVPGVPFCSTWDSSDSDLDTNQKTFWVPYSTLLAPIGGVGSGGLVHLHVTASSLEVTIYHPTSLVSLLS